MDDVFCTKERTFSLDVFELCIIILMTYGVLKFETCAGTIQYRICLIINFIVYMGFFLMGIHIKIKTHCSTVTIEECEKLVAEKKA